MAVHDGRLFVANSDGMPILSLLTTLRFGPPRVGPGGTLRLSLSGVSGERVRVQRSANLVAWEDWQTVILGPTPTELDAETIAAERQFYRALEEPSP